MRGMDHNLNYHREDSLRKYHVLRQSPTLRGPAAIFLDAQDLTLHLQLHEQTLHEANVQVQCESFHRITDAIKWAVDWDAYDNITGRRNAIQEKAARNPNHPMHFTDDEVAETNSSKKANRVRSPLEKNHPLMTYLIRPDILERLRVGAKHQLEAYSSTQVEMGRFGGATIEAFEEKLLKMQLVQEQDRRFLEEYRRTGETNYSTIPKTFHEQFMDWLVYFRQNLTYPTEGTLAGVVSDFRKRYYDHLDGDERGLTPEQISLFEAWGFDWLNRESAAAARPRSRSPRQRQKPSPPKRKPTPPKPKKSRWKPNPKPPAKPKPQSNKRLENWEQRFAELCEYKEKHGHANPPKSQGKLGNWVRFQRTKFNTTPVETLSSVDQEQYDRLTALGVIWNNVREGKRKSGITRTGDPKRKKAPLEIEQMPFVATEQISDAHEGSHHNDDDYDGINNSNEAPQIHKHDGDENEMKADEAQGVTRTDSELHNHQPPSNLHDYQIDTPLTQPQDVAAHQDDVDPLAASFDSNRVPGVSEPGQPNFYEVDDLRPQVHQNAYDEEKRSDMPVNQSFQHVNDDNPMEEDRMNNFDEVGAKYHQSPQPQREEREAHHPFEYSMNGNQQRPEENSYEYDPPQGSDTGNKTDIALDPTSQQAFDVQPTPRMNENRQKDPPVYEYEPKFRDSSQSNAFSPGYKVRAEDIHHSQPTTSDSAIRPTIQPTRKDSSHAYRIENDTQGPQNIPPPGTRDGDQRDHFLPYSDDGYHDRAKRGNYQNGNTTDSQAGKSADDNYRRDQNYQEFSHAYSYDDRKSYGNADQDRRSSYDQASSNAAYEQQTHTSRETGRRDNHRGYSYSYDAHAATTRDDHPDARKPFDHGRSTVDRQPQDSYAFEETRNTRTVRGSHTVNPRLSHPSQDRYSPSYEYKNERTPRSADDRERLPFYEGERQSARNSHNDTAYSQNEFRTNNDALYGHQAVDPRHERCRDASRHRTESYGYDDDVRRGDAERYHQNPLHSMSYDSNAALAPPRSAPTSWDRRRG